MKTKKHQYIALKIAVLFGLLSTTVFGATISSLSNDGRIEFWSSHGNTEYINVGANSSIIWNELRWFYFDRYFGIYRLDWSSDPKQNVHFADSTTKCTNWYGYQLAWRARSDFAGTIDLSNIYYCVATNTLHGTANLPSTWEQSFEGISFQLIANIQANTDISNNIFTNDTTTIDDIKNELQQNFDSTDGSQFYIIK